MVKAASDREANTPYPLQSTDSTYSGPTLGVVITPCVLAGELDLPLLEIEVVYLACAKGSQDFTPCL